MVRALLLLFLLSSCGLKVTNEIDENVLIGTWELEGLTCFDSEDKNVELESYDVDAVADVSIIFAGNKITYEVVSTCTTSAVGQYRTDFNGDSLGEVDFFDLITGSTCDVDIADIGPNTVGTISVNLALLQSRSNALDWIVDGDSLELELGTLFVGSTAVTGCLSNCYCVGSYSQSN